MSSDINLITRNRSDVLKEKRLKQLKLFSYTCLALVCLFSIVLFLINLTSPLAKITSQEETLQSQITSLHQKEAKLALIKSRTKDIITLRSQSLYFMPILDILNKTLPSDVSMNSVDISDTSISLTLTSTSLQSLNDFLNKGSIALIKDKKVQTITLGALVSNVKSSQFVADIKIDLL